LGVYIQLCLVIVKVTKFVSEKEVPGVASCTITTNNYIDYYVEEYNPGNLGIQPHNFVIKDGEPIEFKFYDNLKPENNFEWLNLWLSQNNKTIEPERSYTQSDGSTFVFKTNGADVTIILRSDFIKPKKMKINSAFFAPFNNQKLTKTINFQRISCIFIVFKNNNCSIYSDNFAMFDFCFVKTYLLQNFIRDFTKPVNMTALSKYMEQLLFFK